jgi:hypothetical protein
LRSTLAVPAVIASAGDHAARRHVAPATIRNKNTRMAYYRAACRFFAWLMIAKSCTMRSAAHRTRVWLIELDDAVQHRQGMYEPFANMAPNSPSASPLIPSEK